MESGCKVALTSIVVKTQGSGLRDRSFMVKCQAHGYR